MDIGGWLRSLGLERYEAAFRENEIDETVLPNLDVRSGSITVTVKSDHLPESNFVA